MGGLGNQLFQMAASIEITSNSEVILDCDLLNPRRNREGLPEVMGFELPNNVRTLNQKTTKIFRKILNVALRIAIRKKQTDKISNVALALLRIVIEVLCFMRYKTKIKALVPRNVGWEDLHFQTSKVFMYGYFQSFRWFEKDETLSRLRGLKLKNLSDKVVKYRSLSGVESPIILHIRRGDYRNEPGIGLLSLQYYEAALRHLKESSGLRNVWVFSDEPDFAREFIKSDSEFTIRYIEDSDLDSCATLEVMRLGSAYILANSTFSYWSAVLSYSSNPLVVCPNPWFKNIDSPNDICPSHWKSIKV